LFNCRFRIFNIIWIIIWYY